MDEGDDIDEDSENRQDNRVDGTIHIIQAKENQDTRIRWES